MDSTQTGRISFEVASCPHACGCMKEFDSAMRSRSDLVATSKDMHAGLRKIDFRPEIYLTGEDFDSMTEGSRLCDNNG